MNNNTLIDPHGRGIDYLRISVTDRCDLRCTYCLPKGFKGFEEPEHWLTFNEIERVVRGFAALGVKRVRLTGGEPLLRCDLPDLADRLAAVPGIEDLSLSSNCTRMAQLAEPFAGQASIGSTLAWTACTPRSSGPSPVAGWKRSCAASRPPGPWDLNRSGSTPW